MATKEQTFHDKFVEIQQLLKANKDNYNSFGKYAYRSAESILEAVKPLAHERGLTIKVSEQLVNLGDRYYIESTAILSDSVNYEQATAYAREADTQAGMSPAQVTGSTSSYAKKYSLSNLFSIDDNKDDDSTNTHGKGSSTTKQPNIPKTPTPKAPAPSDKVRDKALATPSTSAGNPPSKVAEAPKVEQPKGVAPNKAMDVTDEESRKAKAKKAFEGLDKATVLGYIIKDLKLKYVSINDFIEKEPIDLVLSTYAAVQSLPKKEEALPKEEK